MSDLLSRRLFWFILVLYLLLAGGYGVINPLFEAPDEHHHFFTVLYIGENGRLPYVAPDHDEWLSQQAAQPPLYYLLGSLLVRPLDSGTAREQVWLNPFATIGDAAQPANLNRVVHGPWEAWPWQGYALAAHLLRFMSTLMGLGTLLFVAAGARLLWPEQPDRALLALALLAVWPQFLFLHASVTNDALITLLASAGLYQLLWLWQREVTPRRLLVLGLTIGLAALSKNAGLLLLFYSLGVLALLAWRHGRFSLIFQTVAYVLLPTLLLAGWLWRRNWLLYADPLATEPFIRLAGGSRNYTLAQVLAESSGLWKSLFAIFGWFNLHPPDWVHGVWSVMVVVALIYLLRTAYSLTWTSQKQLTRAETQGRKVHLRRAYLGCAQHKSAPLRENFCSLYKNLTRKVLYALHAPWFTAVLLAGWVLIVYGGLVAFMLRTEAAQGRLLFPAILPLVLALAYGLSQLPRRLLTLAPLAGFVTAVYCLFFVIAPAYARPPTHDALPAAAIRLEADMGAALQLVGAQIDTTTAVPGDLVWVTLYWQTAAPPQEPPELVIEILGQALVPIGRLHSYHGRGLYPANLWPPDQIVADRVALRLEEAIQTPVWATIFTGLAGHRQRAAAGQVEIRPERWPDPAGPALAYLGDGIILTAVSIETATVRPGESFDITVQWQVNNPPPADFTTLVHIGEAGQPPLVTGDRPPLQGQYPTRLWPAGAVINDAYSLSIPPDMAEGRYPIWLGLYDSVTFTRLPLLVDSRRQADDVYPAGWIEIVK